MRPYRLAVFALIAVGALGVAGCGGNHSADTAAPVFLSTSVQPGPADVAMSGGVDVTIGSLTIESHAKSPTAALSAEQDAQFTTWVITPVRSDGGTVASPQWQNNYTFYVPANGTATLQNFRIFPSEYFLQAPLSQLRPENGGFDKETGKKNIRQTLNIVIYGKTVAGQGVTVSFPVDLNFYYVSP